MQCETALIIQENHGMKSTKLSRVVSVILLSPMLVAAVLLPSVAQAEWQDERSEGRSPDAELTAARAELLFPLRERTFAHSIDQPRLDEPYLDQSYLDQLRLDQLYLQEFEVDRQAYQLRDRASEGADALRLENSQAGREEQGGQKGDRLRQRLWMDDIRSTLEVDVRSESLQQLEIFESEEEKESFSFAIERPIWRSRRDELSWSLGFSYRDEALSAPAPPGSPPPGSLPPSGPPLDSPPLGNPPLGNPPLGSPPDLPSAPPTYDSRPTNPSLNNPPPKKSSSNNSSPNASPGLPLPSGSGASSGASASSEGSLSSSLPPAIAADALGTVPPRPSAPMASSQVMRTGVVKFAQNYRRRDRAGQWLVRSQFNLGTELANSPEAMGADSQFFSWAGTVERAQRIGNNHQLALRLETQLSPNSLLPMHQFKTKDRRFELFDRSARPNEISGNNGMRLYLEDNMVLLRDRRKDPLFSLVPFFDAGYTWGQRNSNRASQQFLGRSGLGVVFEPLQGLNIRYDYLAYWGDLDASSHRQDQYLTLTYRTRW